METAMSRNQKQDHNSSAWRAFAQAFTSWQANPVSRRHFLQGMSAISAGIFLPVSTRANTQPSTASTPQQAPWPTLVAVQDQLFPSEPDGPGASDINAASYLKNLLEERTFDRDEREFILNGPTWLNELATTEHGKVFTQLSPTQQQQLLQRIARSEAGENWLSLLLLYIFEALLSSPIYGGNPDGIGWRWLEHNPGFPQPTVNTSYKKLSQR
jgi:gluconate 2-dehydrogenase gamma chain